MWAHSLNSAAVRHALVDHLRGTGELAGGFAAAFGAREAGYFLGLSHDMGKASCEWQDRLLAVEASGAAVGVDHKSLAVERAIERRADLLGVALHGHHGGLTRPAAVADKLSNERSPGARRRRADAERALRPILPELFDTSSVPLPAGFDDRLEHEMLVRFLFSALVDADGLDTAAHKLALRAPQVAPPADMAALWDRFSVRRKDLLAGRPRVDLDRLRDEVYYACVTAAAGAPGIYRLPAPTGAGKTLASAGFALRHAAEHGKSRVIVAVPFMTITEQNADVYRRLLDPVPGEGGRSVVLEHHSSVRPDDGPAGRWQRLAAENWDAPFVVTTTVQLFESLFGRKPSRMRKVHRLANAVLVLDEVQALPAPLLLPIVDALRVLAARFGTTVLLASATQPELWSLSPLRGTAPTEIVAEPARLYEALRRVHYEWWTDPRPTLAEVIERVAEPVAGVPDQVLTVVNTIANARAVFEGVSAQVGPGTVVRHLSTAMCAAHRRTVLTEVKRLLAAGEPVRLVTTQLIEAGVDIDFPVVYRALAPADSLAQAAGRANREGGLGRGGGLVVVFDPSDGGSPGAYTMPVGITQAVMGENLADPDDLDAMGRFYRRYLSSPKVSGIASRGAIVQDNRAQLDFEAVADGPLTGASAGASAGASRDLAKAFRMIDDVTVPLVVRYPEHAERVGALLDELRSTPVPPGRLFRDMQPYLVTITTRDRGKPEIAALCDPLVGDLAEWTGGYDDAGLILIPPVKDYVA